MFLWLGHNVTADWVQKVFGVQSAAQIDIDKVSSCFFLRLVLVFFIASAVFVSPAKQKRDICTAFPAAALSSAAAAA